MVKMHGTYEGKLRCSVTHEPSGRSIATDAPRDNQGLGEAFSPTDLVGAALGTCMMTIMGIYAQRHEISLAGSTFAVEKEMVASPARRIGRLSVVVHLPRSVPEPQRGPLEKAALACPVHKSLHPDVQAPVEFHYDLETAAGV
jgi:uncharacterized OsmC-like protein